MEEIDGDDVFDALRFSFGERLRDMEGLEPLEFAPL